MPYSSQIKSLGISGLRSIHRDQPVTLPLGLAWGTAMSGLWGASGSGTSTILEGLELLAEAFVRDPKGSRLPLIRVEGSDPVQIRLNTDRDFEEIPPSEIAAQIRKHLGGQASLPG
jgi:hypothetical protein